MFNRLYNLVVTGNQKAIVGFIVAAAAVYIAQFGWSLDTTVGELIEALVAGTITAAGVWFKRNQ